MKVDPEKLEQEAEELIKQMLAQNAGPEAELSDNNADDSDTQNAQDEAETPPAESADTGGDGDTQTPQDEDRGDPNSDGSDAEKRLRIAEERVKNAQSRMTKATQEAAELRKIVATLQSQMAGLQSQIAESGTGSDGIDDELKALAEEYPDIAQPLLKKLSRLEETVTQYRNQLDTDQSRSVLETHFDTIRKSHSDMDDIVVSDDFTGWLERQSPVWQRVAQNGSAEEVVELLGRYKETFDSSPQQTASKVDRARRVAEPSLPKARKPDPSAGKRIWSREEISRMPLDEFEKRQTEIDIAYMDGRVR